VPVAVGHQRPQLLELLAQLADLAGARRAGRELLQRDRLAFPGVEGPGRALVARALQLGSADQLVRAVLGEPGELVPGLERDARRGAAVRALPVGLWAGRSRSWVCEVIGKYGSDVCPCRSPNVTVIVSRTTSISSLT
jgi:hypothetical protein